MTNDVVDPYRETDWRRVAEKEFALRASAEQTVEKLSTNGTPSRPIAGFVFGVLGWTLGVVASLGCIGQATRNDHLQAKIETLYKCIVEISDRYEEAKNSRAANGATISTCYVSPIVNSGSVYTTTSGAGGAGSVTGTGGAGGAFTFTAGATSASSTGAYTFSALEGARDKSTKNKHDNILAGKPSTP